MSQDCFPLNCTRTCDPTFPSAANNNCSYVSTVISQRQQQRVVVSQAEVDESSGLCRVTFLNRGNTSINLCDGDWAIQLGGIEQHCGTSAGMGGGSCTSPNFTIRVMLNTASSTTSLGLNSTSSTSPSTPINKNVNTGIKVERTPAIVGSIFGILLMLCALVILWLWRRQRRASVRLSQIQPYQEVSEGQIQFRISTIEPIPPIIVSPTPLFDKPNVVQMEPSPFSNTPESENSTLSMVTTPDRTALTTPRSIARLPSSINQLGPGNDPLELGSGHNSISARDLARASAPNLSEGDITRLADTIVARIHAVVAPPVTSQGVEVDGMTGLADDPPPAWRSSWAESDRVGGEREAGRPRHRNSELHTERRLKVSNRED